MRYAISLLAACLISVVGYLLLFGFVVSRPLVVDQIEQLMEQKLAYAARTPHPKIFILAGSNARFSHSCAVLEQELHRPCVNMGVAADVALDWTFSRAQGQLRAGDLGYLPIEYDLYSRSRAQALTGMDAAFRFRHEKTSLIPRGPEGVMRAAFMFGLPTLIQSVGEMGLNLAGVRRRFNLDTVDSQGDEIGHDGDNALPYRALMASMPGEHPDPAHLMDNPDGSQGFIAAFLDWCRENGVAAVGGLPTVFNDRPVDASVVEQLRRFYARHGAQLMVLGNLSQYPRDDFYDTGYHLRQSAQLRHSRLVAIALAKLSWPGPADGGPIH
jgi:hypothetical protein